MSFAVFNEGFYLANYPDVQAAVSAGTFKSGLEHFQKFGLAEGRISVSPFYNENFYLQKYPDVAVALASDVLRSGLQHFVTQGEREGRQASELFDEDFYLRKNPDVAAAVKAGIFSSGLAHYLQIGQDEGRSATSFNEFAYQQAYPDIKAAVEAGIINSALEHFIEFGQFENRTAIFNGTSGNDTVIAFGQLNTIYGIDINLSPSVQGGQTLNANSFGDNETDVLIGSSGQDTFVLGNLQDLFFVKLGKVFYAGNGNADFAQIDNLEIGKDEIVLAGAASNYEFVQYGDSLNVYLTSVGDPRVIFSPLPSPDLIASIQGVTSLSQIEENIRFIGGEVVG